MSKFEKIMMVLVSISFLFSIANLVLILVK